MSIDTINKAALLATLPAPWPDSLLPHIQQQIAASERSLVVLDDDPTGTQTVYALPVLTDWSLAALSAEFAQGTPTFYVLTNSRSLPLPAAQTLNGEIGRNLLAAAEATGRDFAVVSRSDSTLRGHYPGETDALVAALGQTVDATLIIPFFLEGGRLTIHDVHYVAEGDQLVPAAATPFARDAAFGYHNSDLRQWVAEKTAGRVAAKDVASVTLAEIRNGGPDAVAQKLLALPAGAVCIINCAETRDMEVFVSGLLAAEAQGRHYLYRTAATFVQVRAGLAPLAPLTAQDLTLPATGGGLVVVGSYVPKSTTQLNALLAQPGIQPVEVSVDALLDDEQQEAAVRQAIAQVDQALAANQEVVVYTSRRLITGDDAAGSLAIGQRISASLVAIVRGLHTQPRYLIAKGGITSSDLATKGLAVKRAWVRGQILPGIPLWELGAESRYPGMVYVVFPGNVGGDDALVQAVTKLRLQ
ncbi:MAG: four-carbon acid sugar kinase family protein [Caldilineaceae bacterium]